MRLTPNSEEFKEILRSGFAEGQARIFIGKRLPFKGAAMKQEILCQQCGETIRGKYKIHVPPGEGIKFLNGRAIKSAKCVFNGCVIKPLDWCVAMSLWNEQAPYFPWEHLYIIAKEE